MWVNYNANPEHKRVGDCTVRAISTAINKPWDEIYLDMCMKGLTMHDLPNADSVWGEYLRDNGFKRSILPCDEGVCVTVEQFCHDHPKGVYLLCPTNHIVAVINGDYFDIWDCGDEIINYYWERKSDNGIPTTIL